MRRPNTVLANSQGSFQHGAAPAGRHLVVFGHIWVPPEYEDQPHQHTRNRANVDEISSDYQVSSAANGTMELMQSFQGSGKKLTTNLEHVQDGRSGQLNYVKGVQCPGGTVHAGAQLLRLCQEENYTMSSDQEPLHCESRNGLGYSIHHHDIDEGCNMQDQIRKNAADIVERKSDTTPCRHDQQQQGPGSPDCEGSNGFGNHKGSTVLMTAKDATPPVQLKHTEDDQRAEFLGAAAGKHS